MSVLIVEDDLRLARTVTISLRARGYEARAATNGSQALALVEEFTPDVIVLDLGLPDMDGTELIGRLRAWTDVPIVVLSGRSESADKVDALDLGADDYVTKPFEIDELLARLRALVRRVGSGPDEPSAMIGDATVDFAARRVSRGGEDIRLTPTEWHLLEVLVRNPGVLLSQRRLLGEVWGPGYESARGNLRLYMAQLRKKLEPNPAEPRHLINEPGLGYRFEP
ncbi:MAG TPA: response regulator [Aeromicrobium sp.]|nr:response regulator [Aeromicrobium sp.]